MNDAGMWLTIALMTLATIAARGVLFIFAGCLKLPPKLQRALRYAPAAAMAGIVVPDLLLSDGFLNVGWGNHRLMAGIGALLFFAATRRMLGTIVVGMSVFTALRLLA